MKTQRLDRIMGLHRYLTFGTTRTAEFSALCTGRPLPSRKFLATNFCERLSGPQGH